jgi:hypothetical protein
MNANLLFAQANCLIRFSCGNHSLLYSIYVTIFVSFFSVLFSSTKVLFFFSFYFSAYAFDNKPGKNTERKKKENQSNSYLSVVGRIRL